MQAPSASRKNAPSQAVGKLDDELPRLVGSARTLFYRVGGDDPQFDTRIAKLLHALRAHSGIEQCLRGRRLLGIRAAHHAHFLHRLLALIEDPPADLHYRHRHQQQRSQLKDARRLHARAASASRSACAQRVRSALLCASDRKQVS